MRKIRIQDWMFDLMNKLQNSGKTFIGVKTHQLWIKKYFLERKIGMNGFKAQFIY